MINFRYHLVSMVAVFLALGVGLLLGSIVLKPYVGKGLLALSSKEKAQIEGLQKNQDMLNRELAQSQQFAQAGEHQLIGHLLAGQRVVVIAAPGAPGSVTDGVTQMLHSVAGATVTGQVRLQQSLFGNSRATQQQLASLAQTLAPTAGITLRPGSGVTQAGQVLASALLTRDGPGQPIAGRQDSAGTAVLHGFTARGFVTMSPSLPARATLAVVVIPDSPPSANPLNHASQALVTLAEELEQAGKGTVVAGSLNGSGPGSAIDIMRNGGRPGAASVSSVDNADNPVGQIIVVQALYEQMKRVSGSYGWLPSANQPGPSPAPSVTPTVPPATTPGRAGRPTPGFTPSGHP